MSRESQDFILVEQKKIVTNALKSLNKILENVRDKQGYVISGELFNIINHVKEILDIIDRLYKIQSGIPELNLYIFKKTTLDLIDTYYRIGRSVGIIYQYTINKGLKEYNDIMFYLNLLRSSLRTLISHAYTRLSKHYVLKPNR